MMDFNDEDYPEHSRITPQFEQSGDYSGEFESEASRGSSNDGDYIPQAGDRYILKLWIDQYSVNQHNGESWLHLNIYATSDEAAKQVEGMALVGKSRNGREYYRRK